MLLADRRAARAGARLRRRVRRRVGDERLDLGRPVALIGHRAVEPGVRACSLVEPGAGEPGRPRSESALASGPKRHSARPRRSAPVAPRIPALDAYSYTTTSGRGWRPHDLGRDIMSVSSL